MKSGPSLAQVTRTSDQFPDVVHLLPTSFLGSIRFDSDLVGYTPPGSERSFGLNIQDPFGRSISDWYSCPL